MKRRHDDRYRDGDREPSELAEVFRGQTTPLTPPPGSFDEIRGRARGRRRARMLWTGLGAAGCIAAAAVAVNMTNDSPTTTVAVRPDDASASSPATGHTEAGGGPTASGIPDDSAPAAGGQPAKTAPPPRADTRTAQSPATCRTSDLTIALGAGEGAAGSQYRPLRVTNNASTPCSLFGFPGVSFVDAQGHQIGKPADRDGSQASGRVVMKPGQREQVTLRIVDPGVYGDDTCHVTDATGVRVYPPGQKASVVVPATGLRGCESTGVSTLSVTSYGVH
ncbi:DUF4232 domain-containing protein [Streptomyces sp. TS71-3]|uniref:DUF4232 domain-containing protein n=1 Tax=Streptomyces sp. TS71-3 TaxID=2733862 RepID=UPI001B0F6DC4|nr:DUF4232 domain-containing protein [Streptomyces sp. TS71-3]GHJ39206.1 hypothetical protein Sm713_48150 [Streptomyces sp. TS71-3]